MSYAPPQDILDKYAKVLVDFALNSGRGLKKGEFVYLQSPLSALPFYRSLNRAILDSGGMPLGGLSDDMSGASRYFYENATPAQLASFPDKYYKGLVEQVSHRVAVLAEHDMHELDGVDPKKIMQTQKNMRPVMEWFDEKENSGRYTWTLALYGTPAMAAEAGLSQQEYWEQIIHACYLDFDDPVAEWKRITKEINRVSSALTDMQIDKLHIKGVDADLHLSMGKKRKWLGGSGRNIPSFEIFTSPDWRGTEGWIRFNQPVFRYGSKIEGVKLKFREGRVTSATAGKNQKFLREMLAADKGAAQVGEFSLTDKRLSRITKFMAETLFDENMGGQFGNTHIAVGKSYHDAYDGPTAGVPKKFFLGLGFNESAVHTDMISTTDRTVTATKNDGSQVVIYKNGQFTV